VKRRPARLCLTRPTQTHGPVTRTDRQTDRQTDRHPHTKTQRHKDTKTQTDTDRLTQTHTHTQTLGHSDRQTDTDKDKDSTRATILHRPAWPHPKRKFSILVRDKSDTSDIDGYIREIDLIEYIRRRLCILNNRLLVDKTASFHYASRLSVDCGLNVIK
jgi:hypothetical protein